MGANDEGEPIYSLGSELPTDIYGMVEQPVQKDDSDLYQPAAAVRKKKNAARRAWGSSDHAIYDLGSGVHETDVDAEAIYDRGDGRDLAGHAYARVSMGEQQRKKHPVSHCPSFDFNHLQAGKLDPTYDRATEAQKRDVLCEFWKRGWGVLGGGL